MTSDVAKSPVPRGRSGPGWEPFAALLIGLAAFLSVRGGRILRPGNSGWLMEGDPSAMWLGWLFFRQTPVWQWPLGANPGYGMELGSSIVFSDSVPVFALLFKLLDAWLPPDFQYFGLWLMLCFVLQALFSWKLLCCLGVERKLALLGCAFFVLAPSFLFRMMQGHYALVAHWLVLAALCLYFAPRLHRGWWLALLVLTAVVHAYLVAMVWAIWCADLVQRRLLRQQRIGVLLAHAALAHLAIVAAMAAVGYFMLGTSVGEQGFGIYRLNLLSLIDPDALWSRLLRNQPSGEGEYEGFAFLGLGVLLIGLGCGAEWLRNGRWSWRPGLLPLCLALLGMTLFAITPRVYLGAQEILRYPLPAFTEGLTSAFRASGRLVWPMYYMVTAGILCLLLLRFPHRLAAVLGVVLLAAQWVDSQDARHALRGRMGKPVAWSTPLQAAAWDDFGRHYRKILVVKPRNTGLHWFALGHFAARHGMTINLGYLSRVSPQIEAAQAAHLTAVVQRADYAPDALYVFEDDALWQTALARHGPQDAAGIVDGIRILAPRIKSCSDCTAGAAISVP